MKSKSIIASLSILLLVLSSWFLSSFIVEPKDEITLKEINNISYYPKDSKLNSELTQLNLIIPEGVKNPPVFLWIGGGAWAYVNRGKEMDLCRAIAKQGILMASVGHRLSPALLSEPKNLNGIKHPEHVKDIAQAFKWIYDHSEEYAYSTSNIFIGGFSSGAHLSTLLAADGKYLKEVGLSTKNIKAIIPAGGAFDILHYKNALIKEDSNYLENHIYPVFGKTEKEQIDASPATYIDQFNTPMLLISEGDTYDYNVLFEQALKEKEKKNYIALNCHNETHASLWKKLSWEEDCVYRNYIVDYILSLTE